MDNNFSKGKVTNYLMVGPINTLSLLINLQSLVVEGSTPRHDILGRISDQTIWVDGKTDAIYPISLLIILISFACFTDAKSFPPRCMRIITGWEFCIIISWNLGLSYSQCMPLVPSQTTLLLGIPRFNDPLNSAISCKWVINESPMSQISVSGYKERRIIWPHIEFTNEYIFQRHLTAICPAFLWYHQEPPWRPSLMHDQYERSVKNTIVQASQSLEQFLLKCH